jgi:hypothetical protein
MQTPAAANVPTVEAAVPVKGMAAARDTRAAVKVTVAQ